MTNLTVQYFVEMGKILGLLARKSIECCKKVLTGHNNRLLKYSTAENHVNHGSTAQKFTERKKYGTRGF